MKLEDKVGNRTADLEAAVQRLTAELADRKQSENRFRAVVESAPNAMIMVDAAGRIVLVNAQAEKLFGYSRQEMLDQPLEFLIPERFRGPPASFRSTFLSGTRERPMGAARDLFGLRKDGAEVPLEIGLNPIDTDGGSFVLAAVVDVTEPRRAQKALAQKSEEMEAFVYNVSHDLRTPLVNLQGFTRELEAGCRELRDIFQTIVLPDQTAVKMRSILEGDIPEALRYISAGTHTFERLITALLGLSRTGRQEYRYEMLDIRAVVETTLDSMRQTVERTKADVRIGALPKACGDPTAVGQVFSNLIANALTYLSGSRPGIITIGGEPEEGMCHYWVRDNGVGIPAAARERVFHVFQRFHPEMAPGEGMGLAIIKRIVDRHGGKVWVDTDEDVGTTFHLTLPCSPRKGD